MKITHNSRDKECRAPFGAVKAGTKIVLSLYIEGEQPESVRLMLWRGEDAQPQFIDMAERMDAQPAYINKKETGADGSGARYSAEFTVPEEGCLLWYAFEIESEYEDDRQIFYYGNNAEDLGGEGCVYEDAPHRYQITVYRHAVVPEWYKDGIVYQIFPDRFARDEGWRERCEEAIKKVNGRRTDTNRIIEDKWDKPAYYTRGSGGSIAEWPVYGGSLKGIEEKLDYLRSLGVTAIYFNPVFEATSNHRYDTGDYMHIDPALGSDEDFASLADEARKRGIRIILDGVFSHTGSDSIYFDRYGNYAAGGNSASDSSAADGTAAHVSHGAWSDPDSPYRSWYKFDENERCGYRSWWGVEDLPEVDENDPTYREFILGEDGVVAHWMKMGVSGWRLDVADELPDSFIAETRTRIKATDPDGLLMGEVWEDASNKISYGERRRYFMGDELDCTMHYPLRDILLDYINYSMSACKAADRLMCLAEHYPPENLYGALNLIGSHDRERIITLMDGANDYKSATRKVRLLSTLQYCLPGVPCIYYGDEAGLMGGRDPENRSCYPWGHENLDLGYHYRMLGIIYDEHPALKSGEFRFISGAGRAGGTDNMDGAPQKAGLGDDIFAFTRSGKDAAGTEETLLILANRSYGPAEADLSGIDGLKCGYAVELLTSTEMPLDEKGSLGKIKIEALSAMIISLRVKKPAGEDLGRSAGVICHISSLPGRKLGKGARDFVDYIASAGFGIWQVLPLNPAGLGSSPYSSFAAFAGDPAFIDRDELPSEDGFESFVEKNAYWLYDYIAFNLLKELNDGKPWYEWPEECKNADPSGFLASLTDAQKVRARELAEEQYFFSAQWDDLKAYANSKGVRMMGDLPMYMAPDSADVWANKPMFRIDDLGRKSVHAGVPPDAFSTEGQDWGNPLYDWDALKADGYKWWLGRIRQCASRFDILRFDHFRGLSEYFAIPDSGKPKDGFWQHSGGLGFIAAMKDMLASEGYDMKLLMEDLGFMDAGVKNLLRFSGLPGMDIWQFTGRQMMEMCEKEPEKAANRAFYTGTHDNDTLMGWLITNKKKAEGLSAEAAVIGPAGPSVEPDDDELVRTECEKEALDIIRKIYESPAPLAMMQLQDVFLLGTEARMNVPGVPEGNWTWKVDGDSIEDAYPDAAPRAAWLRELAIKTGRFTAAQR